MAFEKLFTPIKIRDLELRNRVVMSAMGTYESSVSEDGKGVTDKLITYHVARAKGGCGLNTVEVTSVDKASAPFGFLSIAEDKYIDGFKKLTDAVHAAGGKMALQLWQGGMVSANDPAAEVLLPNDSPLAPEYVVPAITHERLLSVINAFGAAAKRAVEAGFDAVEFHCAHNYLPHSMLSGGINQRTDEWGGSFENRKKFPLECIKAIRANIPEGMPILMRISCHDDMLPGGLTIEEIIDFCKDAKEAGVDVLNVSRGNLLTAATMYECAPVDVPNGFNVESAARIRKETGLLTMPCGRINKPELAEQILEDDKADLVIMSRAQLADPEFCNKAKAGDVCSIKYCIGCDQGCYDYFCKCMEDPSVEHISCMRNPAVLEEATMSLEKTANPKKVLVAGGGIAGIEAADALYKCGHTPVLYEAKGQLGGQFAIAGVAPRKGDFKLASDMAIKNIEQEGIDIRLNTKVTADVIEDEKPDAVIIAIGSSPVIPGIPGSDGANVVCSHDLLAGEEVSAKKAVVIGGGLVGIECAEYLASKGITVDVVEMREEVLKELGVMRQIGTNIALASEPVTILTKTTCKAIEDGKVIVECEDGVKELEADVVIMAVGSKSNDTSDLEEKCKALDIPYYVVGDASSPRLALNAIHDAYKAVLEINK